MSRAYRVRVSETLTRTVHVEDGLRFRLELLDVVGPERTGALLARELIEAGFEVEGDRARKQVDGIELEVELDTGWVGLRLGSEHSLQAEGELQRWVEEERRNEAGLREELKTRLEGQIERSAEAIREEITKVLEAHLPQLRAELDRAANRVVALGLEERAREMGEIEEIQRDEATGELLIKVRV